MCRLLEAKLNILNILGTHSKVGPFESLNLQHLKILFWTSYKISQTCYILWDTKISCTLLIAKKSDEKQENNWNFIIVYYLEKA